MKVVAPFISYQSPIQRAFTTLPLIVFVTLTFGLAIPAVAEITGTCRAVPSVDCLLDEALALPAVDGATQRLASSSISIARIQALSGKLVQAEATFSDAFDNISASSELPDTDLEALAVGLTEAGLTDQALNVLNEIKDVIDRNYAARRMLTVMAESGDYPATYALASRIGTAVWVQEANKSVAIAQARAGNVASAIQTLQAVRDQADQQAVMVEIIEAQAKAGDFVAAQVAIVGLADAQFRQSAMIKYAAVLNEVGHTGVAVLTLRAVNDEIMQSDAGFARDLGLIGLAHAWANIGEVDQALTTVSQITSTGSRDQALSAIVAAVAKHGQAEQAQAILETIKYPDIRSSALVGMAQSLAVAGLFDQALATVDQIDDTKDRLKAICLVAEALIQD